MWRQTWHNMAGGSPTEYEKIKALDVFEFWALFDMWREKVNNENKSLKERKNGAK